jgi:hypothetical protein
MELAEIASRLEEIDHRTNPHTVTALEIQQPMDGRTKPWLMRASDEHWYVVKVQNNPQELVARKLMPHEPLKILTTELVCGRLGQLFNPALCPSVAIVSVPPDLAHQCSWTDSAEHISAGPSFGSQVVNGVADSKSGGDIECISPAMAARLVVFQTWLHGDDPSALISPDGHIVLSIDHGYYLTGTAWSDQIHTALSSTAAPERPCVLSDRWRAGYWRDDSCFRGVLDELMDLSEDQIIWQFASIPQDWGATCAFMADLASYILARRSIVRLSVQTCWQ